MSDPFEGRPFPRAVLIGAAVLISFVIVLAAFVRMTGIGRSAVDVSPPIATHTLRFENATGGKKRVFINDVVVAEMTEASAPFIFGVLRATQRQRKLLHVPAESPYRLSQHVGGQLMLEDPSVGERIDLRAFGPDNTRAFAALLPPTAPAAPASRHSPSPP